MTQRKKALTKSKPHELQVLFEEMKSQSESTN